MLETLPFMDVVKESLRGRRRMRGKGLGIHEPRHSGWTFVFFIAMTVVAFALVRREMAVRATSRGFPPYAGRVPVLLGRRT
jgi:hypothetical protein